MSSLYIHVPFCVAKCRYCGFYSVPYAERSADAYVTALLQEAQLRGTGGCAPFETGYIGGGTPSILTARQIDRMMHSLLKSISMRHDAEMTVEANPNSLTAETAAAWIAAGINRLNLGIQALNDDILRFLGRIHTAEQAIMAVKRARDAGFGNIGLDLIYGIAGQTMTQWRESLTRAILLAPQHISIYALSLDDGSRMKAESATGSICLLDDESCAAMYEVAADMLVTAEYCRYELSNFALPGSECRHNLNYWQRGEYVGLGPAAWTFQEGRRSQTTPNLDEYIRCCAVGLSAVSFSELPDDAESLREMVMLRMRTAAGLDLQLVRRLFGDSAQCEIERHIQTLVESGMIDRQGNRLVLTARGMLLADDVIGRMLP